ncbi:hypothetical protein LAZ67_16000685 [Cordylochernes scorpioides]|uniref:Acyltransferase 3 domain-containing protein n=1 Tax=Cordylochernes scorpioides TaxID=51811 RepID=A0ABY6LAT3_9ARAC|nr:hypothetical protein LAZ67_16000685 [Cordylochernes scorpioides]
MSAPKTIMTQLLANGTFSVDSFFFLSGLLVTYHGIRRMQKEGSLNLPYFYIHRFFRYVARPSHTLVADAGCCRLTPLMMVVIGFCATLLRHVTTGPDWLHTIESYDLWCRDNWWTNLLYLNNFIHREQMCLSHTWYSAVDFQLYAISPIVLYAISSLSRGVLVLRERGVRRGQVWYFASMAALFCITTGATFGLTLGYNLPAVPYFNNITPTWLLNEYYGLVYIKPYCRLGPFLVGLATGAYLQRRAAQSEEERANLRGWQSALLWLLAGLLAMAVIFGMYPANQGRLPPPALAAAYSSLARTAWAAGLAWVVLACVMGHAGLAEQWHLLFISIMLTGGGAGYVRTILSCRVFAPLGRLTYAAYLIHPVVMAVFYGSREVVFDFDVYFMIRKKKKIQCLRLRFTEKIDSEHQSSSILRYYGHIIEEEMENTW